MNLFSSFVGFHGALFLVLLIPLGVLSIFKKRWRTHGLFPYLIGSVIAWVILGFIESMKSPGVSENAFFIALAIVAILFLWKFLFGPWDSFIKAVVLGIFLFWILVDMFTGKTMQENLATVLAMIIALIPAALWCLLFLKDHTQRFSIVVLTFFSGCLSTAPILFYDAVVKNGYELHFFLFRITPESFMHSSRTFVGQTLTGTSGILSASIAVTVVSFALVGVIEEWSKHWVTRKSDPAYFSSINDVIQLSIIAAIGFAFAENIVNPNYFIAFVRNFLVLPESPEWGIFLGSVLGRSIITNMLHITCSGVLGYFYGLVFFAKSVLEDDRAHGKRHPFISLLHRFTGGSRIHLYRDMMMVMGLFLAIILHGAFDVAVSLPEILPGRPLTLGELFNYTGVMQGISLILFPALFYVFGGFFLLRYLLHKKSDMREFGHRFKQEVFLQPMAAPVS